MVEFIKIPKKMPFKRRLELVSTILNKKGEVSVEDLVFGWGVTPHYAMTILKWAQKKYSYAEWNGTDKILVIPERMESEGNP